MPSVSTSTQNKGKTSLAATALSALESLALATSNPTPINAHTFSYQKDKQPYIQTLMQIKKDNLQAAQCLSDDINELMDMTSTFLQNRIIVSPQCVNKVDFTSHYI